MMSGEKYYFMNICEKEYLNPKCVLIFHYFIVILYAKNAITFKSFCKVKGLYLFGGKNSGRYIDTIGRR